MNINRGNKLLHSIASTFTLMSTGLIVCTAAIIGIFQYWHNKQSHIDREQERLNFAVEKSTIFLNDVINDMSRKVLFLAGTPPIQGIIRARANNGLDPAEGSSEATWKNRLAIIFRSMAETNPNLFQVRLIDADGQELVRINREGKKFIRVQDSQLQNKSKTDYFQTTRNELAGTVRLFGIDLNREYGEIATPHTAVLRAATPIYSISGKTAGIVVINNRMNYVFNRISRSFDKNHIFYFTNRSGDYLIHPNPSKTFGFDLGHRYRMQSEFEKLNNFFDTISPEELTLTTSNANGEALAHLVKFHYDESDPSHYFVVAAMSPMRHLLNENFEARTQVIWATIILALVGAIIAIISSNYIVRPLGELDIATQQLANGASVNSIQIPVERTDEVGALARSFHQMAKTLQEKQSNIEAILGTASSPIITINSSGIIEEMNDATILLFRYTRDELVGSDISILMCERDRKNHKQHFKNKSAGDTSKIFGNGREVEALRKDGKIIPIHLAVSKVQFHDETKFTGIITDLTELKKVDKLKNEFISIVSHELRTPLTSIKGALGLLNSSLLGDLPDQVKSMITIALNNSDRLLRLINDILDIEKIEAGKISFTFQKMRLAPFLEQAIETNRAYAAQLGASIDLGPVDEHLRIECDPDRLEQVMANLLSNAAKYSPQNGIIHVTAKVRADMVRIAVRDEGGGIPEEFQNKIFGKFAQADSSDTRPRGGSGLGLAISKAIVDHHGGTISFATTPNKGTTFYFDLPLLSMDTGTNSRDIVENDGKILICEDDPDTAKLLQLTIKEMGRHVDTCSTAEEAKKLLAAGNYAAMTLDLTLPDSDGISLICDLRKNPKTEDLPILVVAADAEAGQQTLKGSALTIVDWLKKPIDVQKLRSVVKRSIKSSRSEIFRVLYIEDEADLLTIVPPLIGDGAILDSAKTCAETRQALENNNYDLVILNLNLPDGQCEELLPLIHANGTPPPQVLVFSALEHPDALATEVNAAMLKSRTSNEVLRRQIQAALGPDTTERRFELNRSAKTSKTKQKSGLEFEPTA